ncbi:hypothetical protein AB0G74_27795 [Streptomyces sp. NPDC020875]|uniref:hypothetical protein n=1 Tax=Streptomyces sp. NPDC020875 TaxID=3154898 RepID=UPI0033F14521
MVKGHGKKQRAKQRAQRTGTGHASAAAGAAHEHNPLPDMDILTRLPHGAGRTLDLGLAARLVAACRAGCQPCQRSLARKLRTEQRPTLAVLAGAAYGTLPAPGPTPGLLASPATRAWAPLARAGKTGTEAAAAALAAVEAMSDDDASDLLEDTLDHWAAGGAGADEIADAIKTVMSPEAPPRQRPADPLDGLRAAGIEVFTLDDIDLPEGIDPYHLVPDYGVMLMKTDTPDGRPMPMLVLYPETEGAGIDDLEARTDWEHWGLHGMPDVDPRWRVRARIADRSLRGLVHTGPDGEDGIELWRAAETVSLAAETVSLPEHWWNLLDCVQHVLVAGPVDKPEDPGALAAAGDAGKLLAVVAPVSFV